ncbi:transposase [Nocardia sp. A7]|uniref:transposase n=1 Tax=Nocardia sp. A7 TaxID=2789274 RepID=UPI00397A8599
MELHGIGPSNTARLLADTAGMHRFGTRDRFASWCGDSSVSGRDPALTIRTATSAGGCERPHGIRGRVRRRPLGLRGRPSAR